MKNVVRFILQIAIMSFFFLLPFYMLALMEKSKEFTFIVIVVAIRLAYKEIKECIEED